MKELSPGVWSCIGSCRGVNNCVGATLGHAGVLTIACVGATLGHAGVLTIVLELDWVMQGC
jgi:hypothetical protein